MYHKLICLSFLICSGIIGAQNITPHQNLVEYVNTLQGTNSKFELTRGNTYPTTALPFGMNTWTPQTGANGDGWKYQYFKDEIRGFQQAHQCSSWSNDYAVFSLMPISGELTVLEGDRGSKFSHDDEIGMPHYYKVIFENGIKTEIAPTERGAHLRFEFPEEESSYLVFDGYTGLSNVKIDLEKRMISGFVKNGRGMERFDNFKNYFVIQFDQPFKEFGTWENVEGKIYNGETTGEGQGVGAYLEFEKGIKVQAKVASSYISNEQAITTLQSELGSDSTLEETKTKAADIWNQQLGKIVVDGGTMDQIKTFYSCFFRASLFSRKFYEINKNGEPYYYSPYDGEIHNGYMFTDTGFWDTFRGQFPLNAILSPVMHGRYVAALLDAYKQCGWLPSWSFPSEAGSMIGNHAISLLADAWAKGIRTFDPQLALEAYFHEATNKGPWGPSNGREGWREYFTLGFVPYPDIREGTAKTLEYAYDDFCAYKLAKDSGNHFYEEIFSRHMFNYKNVFDENTGFMRGRKKDGSWVEDFDPYEWGGPFTEGNAWHYLWSVFHDTQGLINLMGGDEIFTAKMDSVFEVSNKVNVGTYGGKIHEMTEMQMANMGQYAHGNQPIQHMIYLYNYAGEPWKAQFRVREVMENLYNYTENGYPGDEDQGQTSSWYVLSALGFYSVAPGTDQYVIGSPIFKKATLNLPNGEIFIVEASNNSKQNVFIKSASINGQNLSKNFITYDQIIQGGSLKFQMDSVPNYNRNTSKKSVPFSLSK